MQFIKLHTGIDKPGEDILWVNTGNIVWITQKDGFPRLHMTNGLTLVANFDTLEDILLRVEQENPRHVLPEVPQAFFTAWPASENEDDGDKQVA